MENTGFNRVAVYARHADMWSTIARDMDKTRTGEIWRADATAAELTALHCEQNKEEVERRLKELYVQERANQTPTPTPMPTVTVTPAPSPTPTTTPFPTSMPVPDDVPRPVDSNFTGIRTDPWQPNIGLG